MTLKIELTPELEQRLVREARLKGVPAEVVTLELLDHYLPAPERPTELVSLLQAWIEGDAEEQRETGEYLIHALDEDRLSDRQLFPAELRARPGEPDRPARCRPSRPGHKPKRFASKCRLRGMAPDAGRPPREDSAGSPVLGTGPASRDSRRQETRPSTAT